MSKKTDFESEILSARNFNGARLLLTDDERILLGKRLYELTPKQSLRYRLLLPYNILNPEVAAAKTADILRMHSHMTEEEWKHECTVMNLQRKEEETTWQKFTKWSYSPEIKKFLEDDNDRLKRELAERRARLAKQGSSLLERLLKRFGL